MDYKQIKKIMEDMENSKLDSLQIEFPDGVKISMTKSTNKEVNSNVVAQQVIEAGAPITPPVVQINTDNSLVNIAKKDENLKEIKSPMVGTFYSSPAPGKEPFVKVGDKVKKGQVVCILEAMKLMNEIESEFDGEIVEICAKDDDVVEYGMPLFKIK